MQYPQKNISDCVIADRSAHMDPISVSTRRFLTLFLIWLLCALLLYPVAAFLFADAPYTVYRLACPLTPDSFAHWLRLLTGWLSGLSAQLVLIFLGTISRFPLVCSGLIAAWRGCCMGALLWLCTHTSLSFGSVSDASLFLCVYFVLSALLLFYGALERHTRFLDRLPGFLLLSGTAFCLYLAPLLCAVIFL